MREIVQSIFNVLSSDSGLSSLLTGDGLGNPAIYSSWGLREHGPYIVLTYLPASEEYYNQNSMELQLENFDRDETEGESYVRCYEIRDNVVRILDGYNDGQGTFNLRSYYNSENTVKEDKGRYRRYLISFEIRFQRTFDV